MYLQVHGSIYVYVYVYVYVYKDRERYQGHIIRIYISLYTHICPYIYIHIYTYIYILMILRSNALKPQTSFHVKNI